MTEDDQLRVGLLLEDLELPLYEYRALKSLVEEQPVEIFTVAINSLKYKTNKGSSESSSLVVNLLQELYNNNPYVFIEADYKLWKSLGHNTEKELSKCWEKKPIDDLLAGAETIEYEPVPLKSEIGYEVPDHVVTHLAEAVDIVVSFEHWILKGRILDDIEHGVLSFHSSDIRRYRGRPSYVWQYLNNEPIVGRTLQQLTSKLDGGKPVVIELAEIKNTDTIWDINLKSEKLMPPMLSAGIEKIQNGFEPEQPDSLGELTHSSDKQQWSVVLRILIKNWARRMKKAFQ